MLAPNLKQLASMKRSGIVVNQIPQVLYFVSPHRGYLLVVAWIEIRQDDLLADWDLAVHGKKPFPIKGLDQ